MFQTRPSGHPWSRFDCQFGHPLPISSPFGGEPKAKPWMMFTAVPNLQAEANSRVGMKLWEVKYLVPRSPEVRPCVSPTKDEVVVGRLSSPEVYEWDMNGYGWNMDGMIDLFTVIAVDTRPEKSTAFLLANEAKKVPGSGRKGRGSRKQDTCTLAA